MSKIHNTKDKVLKLLLSNREKEFTIRAVSKAISVDYKAVHIIVNRLIKKGVISAKRAGQTVLCAINPKGFNEDVFAAESIRAEEALANKNLFLLHRRIKEEVKSPFFVLLLFGSYASGKQRKESDIDLMLITNDGLITKKIKEIISLTPLNIHLADFSSDELISMLKTTEFNVGKDAVKNNVILFGIEDYYRLMQNA